MASREELQIALEVLDNASGEIESVIKSLKELEDTTEDAGDAAKKGESQFGDMFKAFTLGSLAANAIESGLRAAKDAMVDLIKSSVQGAAQAQVVANSFRNIIGDAELAQATLEELHAFASTTPFTITGIESNAKLLLAMGIEAENLVNVMQVTGDIAAATGSDIGNIALAYGQVAAAGQLYGTELRQLVNNGVPLLKSLAKTYGVTEVAAREMVESGEVSFEMFAEAMQNMTEEGGVAFGGMDAQMDTVIGQFSNLQDQAELLSRDFGRVLVPATEEVVAVGQEMLESMQDIFLTSEGELRPEMVELANNLAFTAQVAGQVAGVVMPDLARGVANVAGKFAEFTSSVAVAISALMTFERLTTKQLGLGIGGTFEAATSDAVEMGDVWSMMVGEASNDMDTWDSAVSSYLGTQEEATDSTEDLAAEITNMTSSFGGASSATSEASREMKKLDKEIDKVTDQFFDLSQASGDAADELSNNATEALEDVADSLGDVRTEMLKLVQEFEETQAGGRVDIAGAFVDQEEKVKSMREELAELKEEQKELEDVFGKTMMTDDLQAVQAKEQEIADLKAALQDEIDALDTYAEQRDAVAGEIASIQATNELTDFEQTIQELNNEAAEAEQEFKDAITTLEEQENALLSQRDAILQLEADGLAAITRFTDDAGVKYATFLENMDTQTEETVASLISHFEGVEDKLGVFGGADLGGVAESQVAGTTNNVNQTFSINVTVNGTASGQEIADQIKQELSRSVQLQSLGSS